MSRREILLPWDSQPQEAVDIDVAHPLASRCAFAMPSPAVGDIVKGNRITYAGGRQVASPYGLAVEGNPSSACGSIPMDMSGTYQITLAFWLYWDTYANDDDLAFELTANVNTNFGGFHFNVNTSSVAGSAMFYAVPAGSAQRGIAATRPSDGWHHWVITYDCNIAGTRGVIEIDGVAAAVTNFSTGFASTSPFVASTLYLFSRANTSLFHAGRLLNLRAFRGILSPAERRSLYTDEWGLYSRRIWVPVPAASGPPTLAAIAASNMTTSGARLTVT